MNKSEIAERAARLAQIFHETYERLAPNFGYQTRKASAVPWENVPENNKRLMIAVCAEVLRAIEESRGQPEPEDAFGYCEYSAIHRETAHFREPGCVNWMALPDPPKGNENV